MCQCDMADIGASTYFTVSSELKLGYSYATCGGSTDTVGDYLTKYCSDKDSDSCASATTCKATGDTCGPKTSQEIKTGLACSTTKLTSCSTTPDPTCPSGSSGEPETGRCTLHAGMGAAWALASLLLASRL